jgi:ParB family chromosome partitioning protein
MPKLISIPHNEIVMNVEDNSRRFTAASVQDMMVQLLDAGRQLEPVGVTKYKSGPNKGLYRLMYGFRRVHALKDIAEGKLAPEGSPLYSIQAILHEDVDAADDKTVFLANVAENAHRQEMTPMDQAISIAKMIDEFGMTMDEVAKSIGVSKSRVSQIKALLKLPLEIQMAVETGLISSSVGYYLSKEKSEEKAIKLFRKMTSIHQKPTTEDAKEARRAEAEEAVESGEVSPEEATQVAKASAATRSWKAIKELLDIYRVTDDKKLKGNRQKLVEALIAYRDGGPEKTFIKTFEQCVPE